MNKQDVKITKIQMDRVVQSVIEAYAEAMEELIHIKAELQNEKNI